MHRVQVKNKCDKRREIWSRRVQSSIKQSWLISLHKYIGYRYFFRIKLSMLIRQQCEHDIVEFLRHRIRVSHVALSRHVAWHLRVNKIRFMQTETNSQQKWKRQSINLFRFVSFENANVSRKVYFHIIIVSRLYHFISTVKIRFDRTQNQI